MSEKNLLVTEAERDQIVVRELSNRTIGIRSQEFHEGLMELMLPAKEAHMRATILVGKTAALSTHLKGLNYIDSIEALIVLGSTLGISRIELEAVLTELQELDFANVVRAGQNIRRIELKVPELRDGYEDLGARWFQHDPTEMEHSALRILEEVASFPLAESKVFDNSGLPRADFDRVVAIGREGALIDRHEDQQGDPILYSPLTVEEKPEALIGLANKFPMHRIVSALNQVKSQQGIPVNLISVSDPEVIHEAVALGVLCPVQIQSDGGHRTFLFSPKGGLTPEERIILDKARAILACVRFGEHYANSRRIKYPRRILEVLRDQKRFSRSRPDFHEQYGLLVRKQIGRIEPDLTRPGFFSFSLIDTSENVHALNIAIDLLSLGQTTISHLAIDATGLFDVSGSYTPPLPTRTRMRRSGSSSPSMDREVIDTLSKLVRGVVF